MLIFTLVSSLTERDAHISIQGSDDKVLCDGKGLTVISNRSVCFTLILNLIRFYEKSYFLIMTVYFHVL